MDYYYYYYYYYYYVARSFCACTLHVKLQYKSIDPKSITVKIKPPFYKIICVDKKNQLDVNFCILYFSSNSCSTCFGQPCAHHQELTTA